MSVFSASFVTDVVIEKRQADEIRFALYYQDYCNHGTEGHNRLNLLALLAKAQGVRLDSDCRTLLFMHNPTAKMAIPDGPFVRQLSEEETVAYLAARQDESDALL